MQLNQRKTRPFTGINYALRGQTIAHIHKFPHYAFDPPFHSFHSAFYQQPHTGAVLRDTQIMVSDDDDQKARVRLYRPIYKLHSTQVIITITIIITVNTFIIFTTFDNVYATPLCTFLAVVAYHSAVYTI